MSFETIAAGELEQKSPLDDASRIYGIYEQKQLTRMVEDFASKPCRTVMTFDGNDALNQFQIDLILWYDNITTDKNAAESLFARDLMNKYAYLGERLPRDISAFFCDKNKIIMFRKEQYEKYGKVMKNHGFPDPSLSLIKTWDRDRPFIEELMIMGLFGDFKPCESFEQSEGVYLMRLNYLEKILTEERVRRDEKEVNHTERVRNRIKTWRDYQLAYKEFMMPFFGIS